MISKRIIRTSIFTISPTDVSVGAIINMLVDILSIDVRAGVVIGTLGDMLVNLGITLMVVPAVAVRGSYTANALTASVFDVLIGVLLDANANHLSAAISA